MSDGSDRICSGPSGLVWLVRWSERLESEVHTA